MKNIAPLLLPPRLWVFVVDVLFRLIPGVPYFLPATVSCVFGMVRTAFQVVSPSLSADDRGVGATGLFRKLYDAYPSDNALSGTCMAGQLLDEGYEQLQANGR